MFSRENGTLRHNSTFITVYTGRYIIEASSQGLASDMRQHCCPAHTLDLINLRLIYLLLVQNVNNETLKVKLKSIVQERVSEHCASTLLCKSVRWNRKCNYSLTKGRDLRNLYINYRYALGKLLAPLFEVLKNQTKRPRNQQKRSNYRLFYLFSKSLNSIGWNLHRVGITLSVEIFWLLWLFLLSFWALNWFNLE